MSLGEPDFSTPIHKRLKKSGSWIWTIPNIVIPKAFFLYLQQLAIRSTKQRTKNKLGAGGCFSVW